MKIVLPSSSELFPEKELVINGEETNSNILIIMRSEQSHYFSVLYDFWIYYIGKLKKATYVYIFA